MIVNVLTMALMAKADPRSGSIEFKSVAGHYSIVMPGQFRPHKFDQYFDDQVVDLHGITVLQTGNLGKSTTYFAGYAEWPAISKVWSPNQVLDIVQETTLNPPHAVVAPVSKLITVKDLHLSSTCVGREWIAQVGHTSIRVQAYWSPTRFYKLMVYGPTLSSITSSSCEVFFNSFKIN